MQVNRRPLQKFLLALSLPSGLVVFFWYLTPRLEWSMRWGTTWFEIGWLSIATLGFTSAAVWPAWRRSRHIGTSTWLLYVIPFVLSEVMRIEVALAVKGFSQSGNAHFLTTYAAFSAAYVAVVLCWIMVFPYERMYDRTEYPYPASWRLAFSVIAAVIVLLLVCENFVVLASHGSNQAVMDALQRKAESVTLIVFVVLIARMFAPATATLAFATFQSKKA